MAQYPSLSAWQHAHSHSHSRTIIPPGFPITPSFSSHPSRGFLLLLHLLAWRFGRPPPSNRLMPKKAITLRQWHFFSLTRNRLPRLLYKKEGGGGGGGGVPASGRFRSDQAPVWQMPPSPVLPFLYGLFLQSHDGRRAHVVPIFFFCFDHTTTGANHYALMLLNFLFAHHLVPLHGGLFLITIHNCRLELIYTFRRPWVEILFHIPTRAHVLAAVIDNNPTH